MKVLLICYTGLYRLKFLLKSVNSCKFAAWCPDILADKLMQFDAKNFKQNSAAFMLVFMVVSPKVNQFENEMALKWSTQ